MFNKIMKQRKIINSKSYTKRGQFAASFEHVLVSSQIQYFNPKIVKKSKRVFVKPESNNFINDIYIH